MSSYQTLESAFSNASKTFFLEVNTHRGWAIGVDFVAWLALLAVRPVGFTGPQDKKLRRATGNIRRNSHRFFKSCSSLFFASTRLKGTNYAMTKIASPEEIRWSTLERRSLPIGKSGRINCGVDICTGIHREGNSKEMPVLAVLSSKQLAKPTSLN